MFILDPHVGHRTALETVCLVYGVAHEQVTIGLGAVCGKCRVLDCRIKDFLFLPTYQVCVGIVEAKNCV